MLNMYVIFHSAGQTRLGYSSECGTLRPQVKVLTELLFLYPLEYTN